MFFFLNRNKPINFPKHSHWNTNQPAGASTNNHPSTRPHLRNLWKLQEMLVPNKMASSPRLKTLPMRFTPQRFHRMTTRVWVPGVYKVGAIGMTPPNGLANICTWYISGIYCQLGDNMLLRTFLTRTSKNRWQNNSGRQSVSAFLGNVASIVGVDQWVNSSTVMIRLPKGQRSPMAPPPSDASFLFSHHLFTEPLCSTVAFQLQSVESVESVPCCEKAAETSQDWTQPLWTHLGLAAARCPGAWNDPIYVYRVPVKVAGEGPYSAVMVWNMFLRLQKMVSFWVPPVDGRNPAPPGMYKAQKYIMEYTTHQLLQDFIRQQYVEFQLISWV